jgi:hypothetical protein
MKLHLRVYRETARYFECKERFGIACVFRHRANHLQSCCFKQCRQKSQNSPLSFAVSYHPAFRLISILNVLYVWLNKSINNSYFTF